MPQVTAVLDEKVIEKVDEEASKRGISRSKQIALCVENYFASSIDGIEIERLKGEIGHKDEMIKSKDERIKDLQNQLGWLQTEYDKLSHRFEVFLPPPKRWWQFWRK